MRAALATVGGLLLAALPKLLADLNAQHMPTRPTDHPTDADALADSLARLADAAERIADVLEHQHEETNDVQIRL